MNKTTEVNKIYNEDCLIGMNRIPDGIVDMVLCDPPYGQVRCKWDVIIPFESMWEQLNRVTKENGVICLFGCEPFSSTLRMSNIKNYKYDWYWKKTSATGFLNANKQPLKNIETISVFYRKTPLYNLQKTSGHIRKVSLAKHKVNCRQTEDYGKHSLSSYDSTERYPTQLLVYKKDTQKMALHSTQKPVALLEYLIKTYTNEDELVLDFAIGSGSTAVACINTNRNYIGFEILKDYYDIANDRIDKAYAEKHERQ